MLDFGMIGWKAYPRRLSDGLLSTIEDKQKQWKKFLFAPVMVTDFIEGFEHSEGSGDEK